MSEPTDTPTAATTAAAGEASTDSTSPTVVDPWSATTEDDFVPPPSPPIITTTSTTSSPTGLLGSWKSKFSDAASSSKTTLANVSFNVSSQIQAGWTSSTRTLYNLHIGETTSKWTTQTQQFVRTKWNSVSSSNDMYVATPEEALRRLHAMIGSETPRKSETRPQKWNFATVPKVRDGQSLDTLLLAFVHFGKREGDEDNGKEAKFNVTKSFQRLQRYATWMDKTGRDMIDPPLTANSVEDMWRIWNIRMSYSLLRQPSRFIVWLDLSQIEWKRLSKSPLDSLRLLVYLSHIVLLDPVAQQNPIVFVVRVGESIGVKDFMSHVLFHQTANRLTAGILPVRIEQIYLCDVVPKWAKAFVALLQKNQLLSPTVRERIVTLENTKLLESLVGKEYIPQDWSGCEGLLEEDLLQELYFVDV